MLETRQLRYFVAVAEHLHFANAADVLHVAQSALSTQILQLERRLGVRLLNRAKRSKVSLTEAGALFLVEARQALRQLARAEETGLAAARGQVGRIEVGYVASAAICGLLPGFALRIRTAYPNLELGLVPNDTPHQLKAIEDGLLDAGIIRPRPFYPPGLVATVVHEEPLALAMMEANPLARQQRIAVADLVDETFVVPQFDEEAGFSQVIAKLETAAGARIDRLIRVGDFVSGLTLASAGYGVILIPSSFANLEMAGIVFRDIVDFREKMALAFVRKARSGSPALANVGRIVDDLARDVGMTRHDRILGADRG